jgi:hypothetical protein
MINTLRNSVAIAALAIVVGYSFQARADILVKATDGINTGTADDHATPGLATFSGTIGNFTVSIDLGTGFPDIGSPSQPVLDLTSLDLTTGTTGGTLTVSLTETDFTTTVNPVQFLSSLTGNYVNSQATLNTYFDTTNAHFGTGTLLSSGLLNNQSAVAIEPIITGPYSLTEIVTITAGASSLTSLDAIVRDAPEPATLSVLGAALLMMLGIVGTRRVASTGRYGVLAVS